MNDYSFRFIKEWISCFNDLEGLYFSDHPNVKLCMKAQMQYGVESFIMYACAATQNWSLASGLKLMRNDYIKGDPCFDNLIAFYTKAIYELRDQSTEKTFHLVLDLVQICVEVMKML